MIVIDPIRRWLNMIGITLGLIGAIMVWWWGFPQPSFEPSGIQPEPATPMPDGRTVGQHNAARKLKEDHYRHMSEAGMALIAGSFICQLLNEIADKRRKRLEEQDIRNETTGRPKGSPEPEVPKQLQG